VCAFSLSFMDTLSTQGWAVPPWLWLCNAPVLLLPLFSFSTHLHIVAIVALVTSLVLQPFPIIKLHSTHDMHGVVASHTSSGCSNVFPLAFLSRGFAPTCDFDIIHPQCFWLARTLLLLQLLEIWWGRMFNASLEHSVAPWIKHSQLAINPDCLQARTGRAWPSGTEAPSFGWTVFIVSVNHGGFILLHLAHCAGVIGGGAVDGLLVCLVDARWGLFHAVIA